PRPADGRRHGHRCPRPRPAGHPTPADGRHRGRGRRRPAGLRRRGRRARGPVCLRPERAGQVGADDAPREGLPASGARARKALPVRLAVTDPVERMDEELLDVVPDSPRKPYDMYDVIRRIVDDGVWFDLKPRWARTIITCLARMGGRPVGIVGNQPKHLGGILENDSADKAARFINLCDAFGIPLLFLQDVPGFMVGTKVEQAGIIRHGAKMLYAVSRATVPKITVVVRKAYGAGYYVMCGKAYEPDLIVAWPTAGIQVMGAERGVNT